MASTRRWIGLTWQRRLIGDLMHFGRNVPVVTCHREMNLAPVARARRAARVKVAWSALFAKAFAIAAKDRPELRRTYMPFPWAHLYEHDQSIGMVTVERHDEPEPYPLVVRMPSPETTSLVRLDTRLRQHKSAPLADLGEVRRYRTFVKLPWALRYPLWWAALNVSGRMRTRKAGTFAVSSVSSEGAGITALISLATSNLTFGLLTGDDRLEVRLGFDHRVYDGGQAARALKRIEEVMNGEIAAELTQPKFPTAEAAFMRMQRSHLDVEAKVE